MSQSRTPNIDVNTDEKDSRNVNRMDGTQLFILLESKDMQIVQDVEALIHENLNTSREPWLLCALVDYCMATQSSRFLKILIGVRDPHDKHLFDKLADSLKSDLRESALLLLGHLVRKQPSWLHKIATHKILNLLLNILKTDTSAPTLMNGVLIIVTLLPIIPSLVAPHIDEIFDIFMRLCSWSTRKPGNVPEVYFLHLRVALYALFHRLYAMYPCNFLGFLRLHYGSRDHSRDNLIVFNETIKPMLERVRLHPLLVTASKETEVTTARWKNLEPHDIIVQCSKLSLDEIEGIQESNLPSPWNETAGAAIESVNQHPLALHSYGANVSVPVEPGSLMADVMEQLNLRMPSKLCISDLSPPTQEISDNMLDNDSSSHSKDADEVDVGELNKLSCQNSSNDSQETSQDLTEQIHVTEIDVVQAEEAKEEGNSRGYESKECQFLSTTDTLTTDVTFRTDSSSMEESIEIKACNENEPEASTPSESNDASNVLIERLVHGINRLRFLSHCGHPPEIPIEWLRRTPILRKSNSWPNLDVHTVLPVKELSISEMKIGSPPKVFVTQSPHKASGESSTHVSPPPLEIPESIHEEPPAENEDDAPPTSKLPLSEQQSNNSSQTSSTSLAPERPKFSLLSPVEVLDRHLQLGNELYLKELQSMSLASMKDTDWTHFGGPPPVDELNILRGQISLLHMQLLFERHRCEVHAERNRRLLGKAKKAKALEEQNLAMKDQLGLQEKELHELIAKLHELQNKLDQQSIDVDYKNLHNALRKHMHENQSLESEKKELTIAIDKQKKETEFLSKALDENRGKLLEFELEMKVLRQKADGCSKLEDKVKILGRRLIVLQELSQRQMEKDASLPKPPDLSFELEQFKESALHETEDLKQTIRIQARDIDSYRAAMESLEEQRNSKEMVIAELKNFLESVKSSNEEVLRSKDSHIKTLQRICQRQEEQIMELKHKICIQETTSRPVPSLRPQEDATLTYPLQWHPSQTELNYGLAIHENHSDEEVALPGLSHDQSPNNTGNNSNTGSTENCHIESEKL